MQTVQTRRGLLESFHTSGRDWTGGAKENPSESVYLELVAIRNHLRDVCQDLL
jgi:hypothetical protein